MKFAILVYETDEEIAQLSDSIRAHGVLQPVVVRMPGDKVQSIAGERRLWAAQVAGLTANVVEFTDQQTLEVGPGRRRFGATCGRQKPDRQDGLRVGHRNGIAPKARGEVRHQAEVEGQGADRAGIREHRRVRAAGRTSAGLMCGVERIRGE